MAPNSLYPAYVHVDYHSAWGPHSMDLPTHAWIPTSVSGTLGSYLDHDGDPVDAEVMINALIDTLLPFHNTTTHFDLVTIYTIADELSPLAIPKASAALTQVGTVTPTKQAKAVINVVTFRTEEAHVLKLYLCDSQTIGDFERGPRGGWNANLIAIETELKDSANAWVGRDGAQVVSGIAHTSTLNEKLRKQYRMV